MGKRQFPKGTRPHGEGIQIRFKEKGQSKYTAKQLDWRPTDANLIKAGKLRQDICDAIKHDAFRFADYFPDDPRAETDTIKIKEFAYFAQAWLDSPDNDWTPQSRYKFRGLLNNVWMPSLHSRQIRFIQYNHLVDALSGAIKDFKRQYKHEPSQSTYNNWLLCIRGVFETAIKLGAVKRGECPTTELKNKTREDKEVDPFDPEEADLIIGDIYQHHGIMMGAWFEFGFYSGVRAPSEPSALTWDMVDFRKSEARIVQIRSKHSEGGIQKKTKTGRQRILKLNSRATQALRAAWKVTGLNSDNPDNWVFLFKGLPVITGDPQRDAWKASLNRLNIRYRDAYNMRHTYATFGLMNGVNPAFMAKQLGHSMKEFFETYATWINKQGDDIQMDLIEAAIAKSGQEVDKEASELLN